jgi:N-acyl-D-amino-acid deacylase
MGHDLLIRNGLIVDGSGTEPYRGEVAVDADLVTEIGRITDRGTQEIDAEGHAVTPGFVDAHTHMDAQVFWDPLGTCVCWHGVTTAVMGHCGFTLAPSSAGDSALVVRNLERAEDISGAAMAAGIDWSWTTFPEYLQAVESLSKGINYATNVGHSALRTFVMGERAFSEEATQDEIAAMAAHLRDGIKAGAVGFTTSRTRQHETSDDRPVASRLAAWHEVETLARAMAETGRGMFQMVEDQPAPEAEAAHDERLVDLAVSTGIPFVLGAVGANARSNLALLDRIVEGGGRGVGMTHCRGIGTLSSFRTRTSFDSLPTWSDVRRLPEAEQRRLFAEPDVRSRLVAAVHRGGFRNGVGAEARPPDFDRMRVVFSPILNTNPTVGQLASSRRVDPVEVILDCAVEDIGTFFYQTITPTDEQTLVEYMRHPPEHPRLLRCRCACEPDVRLLVANPSVGLLGPGQAGIHPPRGRSNAELGSGACMGLPLTWPAAAGHGRRPQRLRSGHRRSRHANRGRRPPRRRHTVETDGHRISSDNPGRPGRSRAGRAHRRLPGSTSPGRKTRTGHPTPIRYMTPCPSD